ncbi:hypothetical protein BDA96_03G200500 [Sorghum bicolor]|uniref:Agenet domain-containing protein n=1 Tax=Sorghum bicolor TaxID=4558 RepID=A0A921UQI2_SORBI|nr:hypothetical protein BDA96_03G200500 [Sorghum bicolor]
MVRLPAEEEGKDAGTGSGSWPRTRRYAVGDEVEVLFTGPGFRGARFEATVIARLPGSDRYKVVYSKLVVRRGGPPLREVVAGSNVRPRPPQPAAAGRELELFDLVEACHNDGWWPGVVSDIRPKRRRNQETQFAVSFPLFREVVVLSASFVRPRQEFVYGSWIDAKEVLRGIPQHAEGSHIEVMCDKQGRVWRPATIKKMVGSTNYVVSYGNGEISTEVLHTMFIRPEPIYDKMKLEYELKPSAEVEVYYDGSWSLGVIADVGSCEPRRYRVKVKEHNNANGDDYMIVSSASLRPKAKWDSQEWRLRSTKKYAKNRNYSDSQYSPDSYSSSDSEYSSDSYNSLDSDYSSEFSTPGGNSDQYSSIPNKRVMKENAQTEEVHLRHFLNLRQDRDRLPLKDVMDMEISSEMHVSTVNKQERELEGLGLGDANGEEQILEANGVEKLICTPCDGKERHSLPKALHSKRKDLSVSSLDDVIEIGSEYSCGDVGISDDASHGNFIEISDDSSYNPIKKQRRMNLPDEELHSNHLIHNNQAPYSASRLWQAQNRQHYLLLDASRHSKEHACRNVLSQSTEPLESSQDHSHKDGGQQIPLPGCQVQEFILGRNEAEETQLLHHLHLENTLMKLDDSAAGCENHEMCQKITKVNSWVAGTSIENKKTGISPEEVAVFSIGKLEPPSSGQKGVKADLLCIESRNHNKMEIKNERMDMSLVSAEGFHLETCTNSDKDIAILSYPECNALSQQPWGQSLESVSEKLAGRSPLLHPSVTADISAFLPLTVPNSSYLSPVFSTTSLLLMPKNKMEVFEKLPQNPHFREAWNCPPERREGKALELMVYFANMAVSIKNMRIQDEPRLFEEKMNILLDMEEDNGFEAGPLKVRLHNLLCTKTCQINLKSKKVRLEKEICEIEAMNCGLEQRLKVLDMCVMGMEENKYQEMKASLDMQKTENWSSISKLQVDLCQVEESLKHAEAEFCSIATAPWQSDDGPLLR